MLVVSNGAHKSGSTWLFNILRCMTQFPAPEQCYLHPEWVNPSIHPDKLADLLENADLLNKNYLSKNHFNTEKQRDLLLAYDNVFVLNIKRDVPDAVVSSYYHSCRMDGYEGSFENFYWEKGRGIVELIRRYHLLWSIDSSRVYVSSYEKLKIDFTTEVKKIGMFLGFDLSEQEIIAIEKETTLERLREKYSEQNSKEKFFRKGIVGDWKNHCTPNILNDIRKIEKKGLDNYSVFDRAITKLTRTIRTI